MAWPGSRGHRVHCVIDWEAESTVRLWVAMKDDEKVSFPTARSPAELPESRYGSRLAASGAIPYSNHGVERETRLELATLTLAR
jgi:hypothetical protein